MFKRKKVHNKHIRLLMDSEKVTLRELNVQKPTMTYYADPKEDNEYKSSCGLIYSGRGKRKNKAKSRFESTTRVQNNDHKSNSLPFQAFSDESESFKYIADNDDYSTMSFSKKRDANEFGRGQQHSTMISLKQTGPSSSPPMAMPAMSSGRKIGIQSIVKKRITDEELLENIRSEARQIIYNDDSEEFKKLFDSHAKTKFKLDGLQLKDPETNETLLHLALKEKKLCVSKYLIEVCSEEYLFETFINIDGQIPPSYMSCFHLLAIIGDSCLTERLINKIKTQIETIADIDEKEQKNEKLKIWLNLKIVERKKNEKRGRHSALQLAVSNGHCNLLEFFKSLNLDLNETNNETETLLMCAIQRGQFDVFKELLGLGADPNVKNKYHCTALHLTISYNQLQMAKLLIEQVTAVDINAERIKNPRKPLLMAVKKNYFDFVQSLMNDKSTVIDSDQIIEALFLASKLGHSKIVNFLLKHDQTIVDKTDDFSNTPVMIAAENQQLDTVKTLIDIYKADLNHKNKFRQSIFDLSMTQESNDLLTYLMEKTGNSQTLNSFYLHTAASNGDIKKIEFLLLAGQIDMLSLDDNNNTFIHSAAFSDSFEVLDFFLEEEDDIAEMLNKQNETALHLAVKKGHARSVNILLSKKVQIIVTNNENQNPLHVGVSSIDTNLEIIENIMKIMKETQTAILNGQDKYGNTVLHLAAKFRRTDVIEKLSDLDPEIENTKGELPLHVAVTCGTTSEVKAILNIFYTKNRRNLDHKDTEGYSPLFRSAEIGDAEKFKLILKYGGDLGSTSKLGCPLLHRLIECKKKFPKRSESYLKIYQIINQMTVAWWCNFKCLKLALNNSDSYYYYLMISMRYLTSEMFYKNCNALQYAVKNEEGELFKIILNTPYVYRFNFQNTFHIRLDDYEEEQSGYILTEFLDSTISDNKTVLFDVTYLIPRNKPKMDKLFDEQETTENLNLDVKFFIEKLPKQSCLEYILESKDEEFINNILENEPFQYLVSQYWVICRRGYEILLWIHIIHMIFFTYFVTPNNSWIVNRFHRVDMNETTIKTRDIFTQPHEYISFFGFFLIWPGIIFCYQILNAIRFLTTLSNLTDLSKRFLAQHSNIGDLTSGLMRIPIGIMLFVFDYLSIISSLTFISSTLAWYLMYLFCDSPHDYLDALAMVFIFGWMHTIKYVKGFKDWNALVSILKQILIKDITSFTYIFIFVLISFGYAIHVLLQADYNSRQHDLKSISTILSTFYRMLSPGDIFEYTEQLEYENAGGHLGTLRAVCATYSILSTLVLMNLLIAMMNSTYSDIKEGKSTAWRIESLRKALWTEKHTHILSCFNLLRFKTMYDVHQNRWYIKHVCSPPTDIYSSVVEDDAQSKEDGAKLDEKKDEKIDMMARDIEILHKKCAEFKTVTDSYRKEGTSIVSILNDLKEEIKKLRNPSQDSNYTSAADNRSKLYMM